MNNKPYTDINKHTPQAILIKNWKLYFENGQTQRIKNLAYTLTPVDHDPITRKQLMREPGGHTALVLFQELVSLAACCPQRGLLVNATGALTPEYIAASTGLLVEDVTMGLEKLKSCAWITYTASPKRLIVSGSLRKGRKGRPKQPEIVNIEDAGDASPDLHIEWEYHIVDKGHGPETEKRLPEAIERLLNPEPEGIEVEVKDLRLASRKIEKAVACHKNGTSEATPKAVACHTEAVDINKVPLEKMQAPQSFTPIRPLHKVKPKTNRPFYHGIPQKSKKKR